MGFVGVVSVLMIVGKDKVVPLTLLGLTTREYSVFGVSPVNVAVFPTTPLLTDGVTTEPSSVYV